MKITTLVIILYLCLIPLNMQPSPAPVPAGGHIVVEVIDAMTHTRIPDATVAVYYENTRYFVEYCVRTDNDLLVTESAYYWYDELILVVWHEDYYLSSFQYTVPNVINDPYDIEMEYVFLANIELFRKATNVTADIGWVDYESPIAGPSGVESRLVISTTIPENNTVFGMPRNWINPNTDYVYSRGMLVLSSNRILETLCDYEWNSTTRFYYGFVIGRIYAQMPITIQIPITMFQDCALGVSLVDTVRRSEAGLSYYHNVSTFVYVNETLDCIGDVQVEYGYQPNYIYPSGYISLDDLRIDWEIPENTGSRPWPDFVWVDLYTLVVYVAGAVCVIYVALWTRKQEQVPDAHTLLNALQYLLKR